MDKTLPPRFPSTFHFVLLTSGCVAKSFSSFSSFFMLKLLYGLSDTNISSPSKFLHAHNHGYIHIRLTILYFFLVSHTSRIFLTYVVDFLAFVLAK
ncbi:hypothetical protein BCR43DRAFT_484068 [Syncephalastrum racemosum]|uniref:Uncharacterized protein n=1 Tax=Syncephalastrum racemosum TaxID=13706 RepID=A0A1X2HWB6_SYNRA|nr:hypothetical protein BCR43DRAFT_484068 [Syncephalastrum racemosum]